MGLSFFIMLVIARQRPVDTVMGEEFLRMASVLRSYEVGFLEDAQPTQRYIFKVTDRSRHNIQPPRHHNPQSCVGAGFKPAPTSPNPSRSGNPGRWCVV